MARLVSWNKAWCTGAEMVRENQWVGSQARGRRFRNGRDVDDFGKKSDAADAKRKQAADRILVAVSLKLSCTIPRYTLATSSAANLHLHPGITMSSM